MNKAYLSNRYENDCRVTTSHTLKKSGSSLAVLVIAIVPAAYPVSSEKAADNSDKEISSLLLPSSLR